MSFYLSRAASLKLLEVPSVYHIKRDDLYELDEESFRFLNACASKKGCDSSDSAFTDYCLDEGILEREPASVRRPRLERSPDPSLRYLELQITDRCNLRCKHCYIGDGAGRELAATTVSSVLREFEELQGLRVLLTGGEPLLHSGFDEINAMLPDVCLHTVLFTNGMLLNQERLRDLRVHEIQISIDGMQAAHDRLRGAGTWERAMRALRDAKDSGFAVSASTMVTAWNLADFDPLEDLFRSLGVREWTVDVPCRHGRLEDQADAAVSPEIGGRYLGYGYGSGMHAASAGFGCGLHLMAVLPDGSAAKCTFYGEHPVGNVSEGLRTCWERLRPIRLAELDCQCAFVEACRGGCRYRAELMDGPRGRDPYRCSLYGCIDKPS
jgi:radical SAM protein with 4Fe4S-binding SPASM domain